MSFWDNVKKFAQPYADDDYDDYDDEDEFLDDYDEPTEPVRRSPRRAPAAPAAPAAPMAPMNEPPRGDYNFTPVAAPAAPMAAPVAPVAPAAPVTAPRTANTGFSGSVLNMNNGSKQEVVLFRPTSFNDTSKAAEDLRHRKAVIVNMENVDKAMARRVVDFLSGCVFALDGTVKKIAQSAYLFCPHNMDVVGDLESIQAEVESYV